MYVKMSGEDWKYTTSVNCRFWHLRRCGGGWVYLVNIAQPFADVLKALSVSDVVDQHDAHGSSVVGGSDGVKPLLACCVPVSAQTTAHAQLLLNQSVCYIDKNNLL